jgi:RNase adapter protein RapZ
MTVSPSPSVPAALDLVVITGLSGAGRSTAAKCLEDLDWFVVDNLPPSLVGTMVQLAARSQGSVDKIAVVVDVRSRGFTSDVAAALADLDRPGLRVRVLFLEAADDALVRRFDGVRRPHPLQADGTLTDGITRERELLRDLRGDADLVLDTTTLNVHELRAKIIAAFGDKSASSLHATVVSFGYKYGLPVDADVVVDCRLLPNPHWVPELRPHTGLDEDVRDYVLSQEGAGDFLEEWATLLRRYERGYLSEGKHFATIAVGCTGGKHRSVVVAEQLAERLQLDGVDVRVVHRDLGRE